MKNLLAVSLTTLIMIFLMPTLGIAQEANKTRFGIKGGVNFSNLFTKDADKTKMIIGFNGGMFGKFKIKNQISIQPEIYFITKGAKVTYKSNSIESIARFNLNYIEVPLLLIINIIENVNIHAGPYASYLISSKVKNESDDESFDFEDSLRAEDFSKTDIGIALGAGIDIGAIGLGARYNYGLTTVGKEKTFNGSKHTYPDAKNGVLNIYLAISIL